MKSDKILYSEIFGDTIQGEGQYTGVPTVWIRFFLCNLECGGFGQDDPTKPDTWDLPSRDVNLIDIKDITELPVFERGCDSAYSVAKRYKHLQKEETVEEVVDKIQALLPNGKFYYPNGQPIHFAFTGGEPLLNQSAIIKILHEFDNRDMGLKFVTFETNGTRKLSEELAETLAGFVISNDLEVLWSVSPKLLHTSGELPKKAIKPEVFSKYVKDIEYHISIDPLMDDVDHYVFENAFARVKMQLKFVVNGKQETFDELDAVLELCKLHGIQYMPYKISFWGMPMGGTLEGQLGTIPGHISAGKVADEIIKRGLNVAARVHNYLWSNVVGK